MSIPVHICGVGPTKDREYETFHKYCVEHRLPMITARCCRPDDDMLKVTIDYSLVLIGRMEARYGKENYVWFNSSPEYYAMMGQLMFCLSETFGHPHAKFDLDYSDAPHFELQSHVFEDREPDWMTCLTAEVEKTLPEVCRIIDEALPSIPCQVEGGAQTAA